MLQQQKLSIQDGSRKMDKSMKLAKSTSNPKGSNVIRDYIQCDTNVIDFNKESEVANFYAQRSVFITGASGFVGKCLLEKLLRSCQDIKHVFILMRPKRGKEVDERLEAIIKCELFDRLRGLPYGQGQFKKIRPVEGDITKPNFGLSNEDVESLSSNVSVIIHAAATVKFVQPLKMVVETNVVNIEHLVNLASKLPELGSLVYVSTAYSNCDRKQINEEIYATPIEPEKLMDMCKWMDPDMLEKISPTLLAKRPNTYTLTKAVAESLLADRCDKMLPHLPVAIVRPSIVGATWRQPIRGWIDNYNGATGIIVSLGSGAIKAIEGRPSYCADVVPVDIVANLVICAAWQIHSQHKNHTTASDANHLDNDLFGGCSANGRNGNGNSTNNLAVFNCVSGTLNPLTWNDTKKYIRPMFKLHPFEQRIRRPRVFVLPNGAVFSLYNFIEHASVAYAGDFALRMVGKPPRYVKYYEQAMRVLDALKPFTTNQWFFDCSNVVSLNDKMSPIDKEIFNFDVQQVRWAEYISSYYMGTKIFMLKENPNQIV